MNDYNWRLIYRYRTEVNKDLLRQAERFTLQRQALSGRPAEPALSSRLILWVGRRLTQAGLFLQSKAKPNQASLPVKN